MRVVVVSAEWDDEAKVWVAESANLGEHDEDIAIEVIAHARQPISRSRQAG